MNRTTLERLLSRYPGLWSGELGALDNEDALPSGARLELEAVARLVGLLHTTLTPATPRAEFVEELRRSLLADALRQQSWQSAYLRPLRKHWKLTAAATASGVSVAALSAVSAAIWYRGRNGM